MMKATKKILVAAYVASFLVQAVYGGLLTPVVIDPSFETAGTATAPAMAEADPVRGWFEGRGSGSGWAEYASGYGVAGIPDGVKWGALGDQGGGRLYQKIGTVDVGSTYTITGSTGRKTDAYNQMMVELWAASGFSGADGTDLNGNATYLGGATLSELSLFGNADGTAATAEFSVDITVTTNDGDDLWLSFADVSSLGGPIVTSADNDQQLIDSISVTVDTTPPTKTLLAPTNGAVSVAINTDFVISFSENVSEGAGDIHIRRVAGNSILETIDVTSPAVTFSTTNVTINPSSDLETGTTYWVEITNGVITDLVGNPFAGITNSSQWSFSTPTAALSADAVNVGVGTATLQGLMTAGGPATAYLCWGSEEGTRSGASTGTWEHVSDAIAISDNVTFSNTVSNLYYGIEYHYAIYATNGNGDVWSSVTNFTTVAPTTWTPADITTEAWYDAADTNTIISTGSNVSIWQDKTSNGNDATQVTPANQPATGGDIGGLNAIAFDPASGVQYLENGLQQLTTVSMYLLINPTAKGANGYSCPIGANLSGYSSSGLLWIAEQWSTGDVRNDVYYTQAKQSKVYCNGVQGSALHNFQPSILSHEGTGLSTGNLDYLIGARGEDLLTEHAFKGLMGEIIICPEEHDTTTRQKVEGYLAHKWGIEGTLPSGHQYKTDAPTGGAALFGISNSGTTNETSNTVDFLGSLDATQSIFTVRAYWSTSNNTSEAQWLADTTASNAVFGVYTNVMGQSLSNTVSSLTPGTTYHFTYMASNAVTNIWADGNVTVTTLANESAPTVDNNGGAVVASGTATLRGVMTAGDYPATAYICWGTTPGSTSTGSDTGTWDHVSSSIAVLDGSAFSNTISGLYYGQEYSYAVYATNDVDVAWSSVTNFTTLAPTTWTPADLTTAAWYDGADTDTLWADSVGGNPATTTIAWWEDKSGNGQHLSQPTGGSQPDRAASAIGGKHAVSFNGTSDHIFTSTGLGAAIRSLFLIMKSDTAVTSSSAAILPVSTYGDQISTGLGLGACTGAFDDEVLTVFDEEPGSTVFTDRETVSSTTLPSINTAAHVYSFVLDTDWHIGFDGSANLRDDTSGTRHDLGFTDSFSVGAGTRKAPTEITGYLNGSIGEIICLSSTVGTEDQAKLEGYLAHKWGLDGNLPGGHQYKTDAPTGGAAFFGINNSSAMNETINTTDLLGSLDATQSIFTVRAYWSTSNNTGEAQWLADTTASNAVFGVYTNVMGQSLSNTVSSLTPGTTYHFTYMASNAVTNIWADGNVEFTTLSNESTPGVTTAEGATSTAPDTASLRAELTNGAAADVYICWGADAGNTVSTSSWENVEFAGALVDGEVVTNAVSGLLYGVEYSYVVYATNSVDSAWSGVTNFVTAYPSAVGGDEVYTTNDIDGVTWNVHKFTTVGPHTLTVQRGLDVDYLIVGGGGGGGSHIAGGGGAGGLITSVVDVDDSITPQNSIDVAPGTYSVTVGAGASGDGENSTLTIGGTILTALGGGGGGTWGAGGSDGGSGGGGGVNFDPGIATQPAGGFGNPGAPKDSDQYAGGGGGGAGAAPDAPLNGGAGLTFEITGAEVDYAGGGGGGRELGSGGGGTATHGGGAGGKQNVSEPVAGAANTGGGGGGRGSSSYGSRAAGGSGIVVLRYRTPTVITNTAAANVTADSADLGGILDATNAVFNVYLYWGTNDHSTAEDWIGDGTASSLDVGTYTNAVGQSFSNQVALTPNIQYYYTYMASNLAEQVWASGNKPYLFATVSPTIDTLSPSNGAIDVAYNTNLVATFEFPILTNTTGSIVITNLSENTLTTTIAIGDTNQVTVSGSTVTIVPTNVLAYDTRYAVLIGPDALKNNGDVFFDGLTLTTQWAFTTVKDTVLPSPSPMVFDVAPYADSTNSITMTATNAFDLSTPVEYRFTNTYDETVTPWSTSTTWTNSGLAHSTSYGFRVQARDAVSNTTAWSEVALAEIDEPGIIYEPFAYSAGDVDGSSQAGGVGMAGAWSTSGSDDLYNIVTPGLSFSELATSGGMPRRPGKEGYAVLDREISAVNKTEFVGDETTIWFSILMRDAAFWADYAYDAFLFASDPIDGIDGSRRVKITSGQGLGVSFNYQDVGGTQYMNVHGIVADNGTTTVSAGRITDTSPGVNDASTYLIAGQITWAANGTDDTLRLFNITDPLALQPLDSAAFATMQADLDQSLFDTLTIGTVDMAQLDEIRFAKTFNEVMDREPDTDAPIQTALSPTNGAVDIAVNTDLTIAFDDNIKVGSGNILVKNATNDTTVASIDAASASVTYGGTNVTIDLPSDLSASTTYYVLITKGVMQDLAGNAFAGITNDAQWAFATLAPDETPPSPNQMTFEVPPTALDEVTVSMTATLATDDTPPVSYFFTNTVNGNVSGWTTSRTWTNTGLPPAQAYTYKVKAKDALGNETLWSDTASVTLVLAAGGIIYEPFDYPAGTVNGTQAGGTGFATAGWSMSTAGAGATAFSVVSPGLGFTDLGTSGLAVSRVYHEGGAEMHREISEGNKVALLQDNDELWFRFLVKNREFWWNYENLALVISTGPFDVYNQAPGTAAPTISGGEGIGVGFNTLGAIHALAVDDGVGSYSADSLSVSYDQTYLIVGRIAWAPNGTADTVHLYNMTDPIDSVRPAPFASISADLDQSAFSTIAIASAEISIVDELRFEPDFYEMFGLEPPGSMFLFR